MCTWEISTTSGTLELLGVDVGDVAGGAPADR